MPGDHVAATQALDQRALNHGLAVQAAERLVQIPGVELVNDSFFNEFTLKLSKEARPVVRATRGPSPVASAIIASRMPGLVSAKKSISSSPPVWVSCSATAMPLMWLCGRPTRSIASSGVEASYESQPA